ncbi:unnamed protein product [Meloidogyne enterolobii]|uniref:Uncharacterized protein n=1 Tax=Meloidogyne enterolobii TaxID=390850 RepID=A0ACB1AQ26_MELEN
MNGSGPGEGGIWGNSSINSVGAVNGMVGVQGKSNGANKSVSVSDGIRGINGNGASSGEELEFNNDNCNCESTTIQIIIVNYNPEN